MTWPARSTTTTARSRRETSHRSPDTHTPDTHEPESAARGKARRDHRSRRARSSRNSGRSTELIAPRVTQHPKVIAAFLLVIPTSGAKCFEALHLGFNIVGFEVEVHAVLGDLLVIRALEQHANIGVRESQPPVDVAALRRQGSRTLRCGRRWSARLALQPVKWTRGPRWSLSLSARGHDTACSRQDRRPISGSTPNSSA
jgi:hypothetical protein